MVVVDHDTGEAGCNTEVDDKAHPSMADCADCTQTEAEAEEVVGRLVACVFHNKDQEEQTLQQ